MSIVNLKSETELSGFYVCYKGSTYLEESGNYGISHLSEHLLCKSFEHLTDDFDKYGIAWNAYTSDTDIVFYITGLDEYVDKYKVKFLESLKKFNITEKEFENEKKIVLEEYMDSFNSQSQSHCLNLYRKRFDIFCPIGLKSDLENLTFDDFNKFVNKQYSEPFKIINVSKYNEFQYKNIKFLKTEPQRKVFFGQYNNELESMNEYKDKTSIINISNIIENDIPYIKFVCNMLGGGLNSPLYQEIREKRGLVYYVNCSFDLVGNNQGVILISSETSNKNVKEFNETLKTVLNNQEKYLKEERFDIVKTSYEIQFKKQEINRYNNISKYFVDEKLSVESVLKDITFDKVKEVYKKYFNFNNFYVSIDKEEFNGKNN